MEKNNDIDFNSITLTSSNEDDAWDVYLTVLTGPTDHIEPSLEYLYEQFNTWKITDKQKSRFYRRATSMGINVPDVQQSNDAKPDDCETIIIEPDPKFANIGVEAMLKSVANNFGTYIYGKQFNDGMYGAFGKGQNILSEARNKKIILRIPSCYEDQEGVRMVVKIKNSIRHCESVNTYCKIEWYDF